MVYRGHVQNGNVIVDDGCIHEGSRVEIRIVPELVSEGRSPDRPWLPFAGSIDDLPPNASEQIDQTLYGSPTE